MGKKRSRQFKLEMTVAALHRRFGPRSVYRGESSSRGGYAGVSHIPTGFPELDALLGIGGLPKGRITELVGLATSGKTTMALKFLAQAQAQGQRVAYIDQARYFDPEYAHRCGLSLSRLLIGTPYDATEALAMVEALVQNGDLGALVLDTLDFLWSDASAVQQLNASLARLLAPLVRAGTIFVFLHDPLGGEHPALSVLRHYASVRLQVVREEWQQQYGDVRGYRARICLLKSRFGPSGGTTTIDIKFNGTVRGDGL